jgi:hypothetical protein
MAKTPPATTHPRIHLVIKAPRRNRLHVVNDPNATWDRTLAARKNNTGSFVIKDGHLFLALMADDGIYEFEPVTKAKP